MRISLEVPDDLVQQLVEDGRNPSRTALEALGIDAYRRNRITGHQLRKLLNIPSGYELDGFLKHHGVPLEYAIEDFEREADASARLWQTRRDDRRSPRESEPQ